MDIGQDFIPRLLTSRLLQALQDTPVVLLNGARQTGKSTLARKVSGDTRPASYLTLDDPSVLSALTSDPNGFIGGFSGPIVLDEIQRAPEAMLAIKAAVDRDRQPGRFLLTGSANVLSLPRVAESLAGRMEILTLYPMAQAEFERASGNLIDELFQARFTVERRAAEKPGTPLGERILAGGFPEARSRQDQERRRAWYSSYITAILQRDVRDIASIEGLTLLPRLLSLLAARSGGLLNFAALGTNAGIPQTTLKRYLTLLEMTFLICRTPAWSSNLSKRIARSPKVYCSDTGLAAHLVGADLHRYKTDNELRGMLVETFVHNELLKAASWSRNAPRLYHYRTLKGEEIDFLLERADGSIVALEVKSSTSVDASAFLTIRRLAQELGGRFLRGVVLYAGDTAIPFGANLFALPLSSLWTAGQLPASTP